MLTRTIVIGVQAVHMVKLLAVVLIWLETVTFNGSSINVWSTKWIVVGHLLHHTICIHHLTVIAEVILIVIVEIELACSLYLSISALKKEFVNSSVLHNEASAEKIVGRVRELNLSH